MGLGIIGSDLAIRALSIGHLFEVIFGQNYAETRRKDEEITSWELSDIGFLHQNFHESKALRGRPISTNCVPKAVAIYAAEPCPLASEGATGGTICSVAGGVLPSNWANVGIRLLNKSMVIIPHVTQESATLNTGQ